MALNSTCRYRFTLLPTPFVSYAEAAKQCPGSKLTTLPNLGLVGNIEPGPGAGQTSPAGQGSWSQLRANVDSLNEQSGSAASYKIMLIVRHGLGVHNVVMGEVGSSEWKNHWSKMDGDGSRTWFDAELVDEGKAQAADLGARFATGVKQDGFPVPDTIYTSPLARCLETAKLVFKDVVEGRGREFRPVVKELLRERLTDHTCDRRRPRTWIGENYPEYEIDPSLDESDTLWREGVTESNEDHVAREQTLLQDVFQADSGTIVALVTHSYTVSAILEAVGADHFRVAESAMVALLVRAERVWEETLGREERPVVEM
ncbi:uncharacterized protein MKZ38_008500 [Zalerion maritima]|uniref:Phosphoglycerate mutase n=1 Tax=Zalerion maritima TaxID=339359 RepID=A0AAD5WNL1_9PEZI|nr:uncharacterized protein MKZ38_008500 [Zalerion maritima]